jgi:hypothetical protein
MGPAVGTLVRTVCFQHPEVASSTVCLTRVASPSRRVHHYRRICNPAPVRVPVGCLASVIHPGSHSPSTEAGSKPKAL